MWLSDRRRNTMQKQAKARANALLDTFAPWPPPADARAAENDWNFDKVFHATRVCGSASALQPDLAGQSSALGAHTTAAKAVTPIRERAQARAR